MFDVWFFVKVMREGGGHAQHTEYLYFDFGMRLGVVPANFLFTLINSVGIIYNALLFEVQKFPDL